MAKRTSRKKPVMDTNSIKEVKADQGVGPDEGKRPDGVMSTESIKEVSFEAEPVEEEVIDPVEVQPLLMQGLTEEEEMIVSEIMGVKSIAVSIAPQRRKLRGDDLGPAERIGYKPRDPGANHDIEITLNDETVYVAQFRNGKAKIPQKVAEHIRATFPPGRLVVAN